MSAEEYVEKGVRLLSMGDSLSALAHFERAFSMAKTPVVRSYLGVCIAAERGQLSRALTLCNEAVGDEPENPVLYLNLAKVCLRAGKKADALSALRKGISFGENQEMHELLEQIGVRRKPLIPFLQRGHFLNKYAGLFLRKLGLR